MMPYGHGFHDYYDDAFESFDVDCNSSTRNTCANKPTSTRAHTTSPDYPPSVCYGDEDTAEAQGSGMRLEPDVLDADIGPQLGGCLAAIAVAVGDAELAPRLSRKVPDSSADKPNLLKKKKGKIK